MSKKTCLTWEILIQNLLLGQTVQVTSSICTFVNMVCAINSLWVLHLAANDILIVAYEMKRYIVKALKNTSAISHESDWVSVTTNYICHYVGNNILTKATSDAYFCYFCIKY